MSAVNQLLSCLKIEANVHHNGQYCGDWSVDTSGTRRMTFHVVSKGSCFYESSGKVIELAEGDAVFMPGDASHCVTNRPGNGAKVNAVKSLPMSDELNQSSTGLICGNFTHQHPVFEKLVAHMPELIVVRKGDDNATRRVLELLVEESRSSDLQSNALLNRLADCLLILLVRNNLDVENGIFAAMSHPNLGPAMELIHQQNDSKLTLDNLADSASLSRSAFSSLFKDIVGLSPMDYLTQWRMTQAYRWLADEGISTFDAAVRCGYENESSFSKAFKRVLGVGPGHVRVRKVERQQTIL